MARAVRAGQRLLAAVLAAALLGAGAAACTTPDTDPRTAVSDAWPADAVVYHVFVDRFADGDALDTQVGGEPREPGAATTGPDPANVPGDPDDPGYAQALTAPMGGDLAGLHERLDHIVATGANTLWLSPVTPGPGYHGYHPTDLTGVEPRFGDLDTLRTLVADAQQRGLRVIHDLVLNHTSDQHPWFVAARADCAGSPYVAYYRFRSCPDDYAAFANLPELPQLDLDHPPLRTVVVDEVLPFWLDDIGVDGFRLDHVEGPSRDLWRTLRAELDQRWPGTLLLGEVWASQPIIDTYADVLDAATAFPLRERFVAVFAGSGDVRALAHPVAALLDEQGHRRPDTPRPATFLSSHDQSRFAHEAGGDPRRVTLAYTAVLTLPGLPVIYYGDEVGLRQSDALPAHADHADRWFREPMPWDPDDWDHDVLEAVGELARLRTTSPALHDDAETRLLVGDGPTLVVERLAADGSERLLVALNATDDDTLVTLADLDVELAAADHVEVVHGPDHTLDPGREALTLRLGAWEAVVVRLPAATTVGR